MWQLASLSDLMVENYMMCELVKSMAVLQSVWQLVLVSDVLVENYMYAFN